MEHDYRKIWEKTKKHLPPRQIFITELMFKKAGTYRCCYICGDTRNIYLCSVKTDEGIPLESIMCAECILIQRDYYDSVIEIVEKVDR